MFNQAVLLCLFALIISPAMAGPDIRNRLSQSPLGKLKYPMLLVNVDMQKEGIELRKASKPTTRHEALLPNRVYFFKHEQRDRWYLVLTDGRGQYANRPLEFIRTGSVFSGALLGSKNKRQNYLMNQQGLWVPTFRKEQHYFWQDYEKGRIKSVEFIENSEYSKPNGVKRK